MKKRNFMKTLAIVLSALMACTGIFTIITYIVYFATTHAH